MDVRAYSFRSVRAVALRGSALVILAIAGHATAQMQFSSSAPGAGLTATTIVHPNSPYGPMVGGGAVGDFNNDGWQDIFFVGGGGRPDALFINNGDGTFTDQAAAWGVDATHFGAGAAVGDFNGDGWLDIYVTSHGSPATGPGVGQHKLYRNNGDGTFTDVALTAGVHETSTAFPDGWGATFGDYNGDGHLDLAVAGWRLNNNGNKLFRNNGDGTFTDVTSEVILFNMMPVHGFAPRFVDMDDDGFPELLWTADFSTSKYFINNGGVSFTEFTVPAGVGIDHNGMGNTIGDFNNDGLPDWYVTSIYAVQPKESGRGIDPTDPIDDPITGTGNKLYMNTGNHVYDEVTIAAGVDDGGWGWGTAAVDFDHDGWTDIVSTNGWIELGGVDFTIDPTRLFRNNGDGAFTEMAVAAGINHTGQGRGLLTADFDNDGAMDIIIFCNNQPMTLYRNEVSGDNTNWLRVFLDTTGRPGYTPNGIGARVTVSAGGLNLMRIVEAGSNYLTVGELSAHFGLAGASTVNNLTVHWPNGRITVRNDIAVNQTITLSPPCDADADGQGQVDIDDLTFIIKRFGETRSPADVDGSGAVDVNDIVFTLLRFRAPCP